MIAAGDPRPPEWRRTSQRFRARRQPPSPGLTEASCRLRTRFPSPASLSPREASEAPGSRAASGAAAARGGAKLWTCPDRRALRRPRRLGARSRSGARPAAPGGSLCKLLRRLETSGAGGSGPASCAPSARASRTACDRSGAGRRGRARAPWTRRRARQAAARGGPGLQLSSSPRPGPAEAAAPPPPPPRGRIRSKLPELRAGPRSGGLEVRSPAPGPLPLRSRSASLRTPGAPGGADSPLLLAAQRCW